MSWQTNEPLTHDNAHKRPEKLDPRVNGPFLDDIREEQEKAYREARNMNAVTPEQEETTNEPDGK